MKKIKILFLLRNFEHGGIPRVLANLLSQIDRPMAEIDLFPADPAGIFRDAMKNCRVLPGSFWIRLFTCNYRKEHGVFRLFAVVAKTLRHLLLKYFHVDPLHAVERSAAHRLSGKYDVVWACSEETPARIAQRIKACRKILWIHNCCDEICFESLEKIGLPDYPAFDHIVCVADHVARSLNENLRKMYQIDVGSKTCVMRNIVNQEEILRSAADTLLDPLFVKEDFTIVSVGRLAYEKRLDAIPEMAASIKAMGGVFHWYLIGDGADVMKHWLTREIQKWHVESEVILLGIKKNPYPYLAQADLLVLTSRQEAYPTVVNEALALGTDVMVADINGMSEIVPEGFGSISSIEEMPGKIFERMGTKRAKKKFDFTAHNAQVMHQFYQLVGSENEAI